MKGDAIASELIRSSSDLSDFYDMSSIVDLRMYIYHTKQNDLTILTQREIDHVGSRKDQVYIVHHQRDDNTLHRRDRRLLVKMYNIRHRSQVMLGDEYRMLANQDSSSYRSSSQGCSTLSLSTRYERHRSAVRQDHRRRDYHSQRHGHRVWCQSEMSLSHQPEVQSYQHDRWSRLSRHGLAPYTASSLREVGWVIAHRRWWDRRERERRWAWYISYKCFLRLSSISWTILSISFVIVSSSLWCTYRRILSYFSRLLFRRSLYTWLFLHK